MDARGGARAQDTSNKQYENYYQRFYETREFIDHATEVAPNSPLPAYALILGCEPYGIGLQDVFELHRQMHTVCPDFLTGSIALLTLACEKWFGSHDIMFEIARDLAAQTEDFPFGVTLIAAAHIERWLHYAAFENNQYAADAYLKSPAVREELEAAFAQAMPLSQEVDSWQNTCFYNHFAMAFYLVNDAPKAAGLLKLIQNRITIRPWCYYNADHVKCALDIRQQLGLKRRP